MPTLMKRDKKIRPARETNEVRLITATNARSTTIAVATRSAMAAVRVEIWSTWICEPLIAEDYVGWPAVIVRVGWSGFPSMSSLFPTQGFPGREIEMMKTGLAVAMRRWCSAHA
jgi:hypothetical protein